MGVRGQQKAKAFGDYSTALPEDWAANRLKPEEEEGCLSVNQVTWLSHTAQANHGDHHTLRFTTEGQWQKQD